MSQSTITATVVPENERLDFLPEFFGQRLMMKGEILVYGMLDRLSEDYNGGFWLFYKLSNGGYYMAPHDDKDFRIVHADNYCDETVSADAAGIIATLYALNALAQGGDERIIDLYDKLRDFVRGHPERNQIYSAID